MLRTQKLGDADRQDPLEIFRPVAGVPGVGGGWRELRLEIDVDLEPGAFGAFTWRCRRIVMAELEDGSLPAWWRSLHGVLKCRAGRRLGQRRGRKRAAHAGCDHCRNAKPLHPRHSFLLLQSSSLAGFVASGPGHAERASWVAT